MQVSSDKIAVGINKANYSYGVIKKTGKMNVHCLTEKASFERFKTFGFQSGKTADKMRYETFYRSQNGLAVLDKNINSFLSLKVEGEVDLGSHGLFICSVVESEVFNNEPSMTYAYYHKNVKPAPAPTKAKGYRCKICGRRGNHVALEIDHIKPIAKGGKSTYDNLQTLCKRCNQEKSDKWY